MSDFMRWMYENYIRPQIESQPKDFEASVLTDSLNNELDPQMRQTLQGVLAFHAVQAFRLGVRTGAALKEDLG